MRSVSPLRTAEGSGEPAGRLDRERNRFTRVDLAVWAAILALGAFQFFSCLRSLDFPYEDVSYYEMAKSLMHDGFYGFNSLPERVQPPGLPVLLAIVCKTIGCTHLIFLRSMVVFLTLGFLASYELIRREVGRSIAAATALLLSSSVYIFALVTQWLWPSFPYFFVSLLTLLVATRLGETQTRRSKYFLSLLLSVLVASSILIQSAGIALLGAFVASIGVSFLRDRLAGIHRLKVFLPALILGIATQVVWMQRGSNPPDWPLPGYPGSYTSQLKLKNGNYPELGFATTRDVALRAKANLQDRTAFLTNMLTRHWINHSYSTLGIAVPLALVVIGVGVSLWGGRGDIYAWYLLGYEFIYILWPWTLELRFLLPSAPLACLFMFRGARSLARWAREHPRRVGAGSLPLSLLLSSLASLNGWETGTSWNTTLQWRVSAFAGALLAILSVWMIWKNRLPSFVAASLDWPFWRKRYSAGRFSFTTFQLTGATVVAALIAFDVAGELPIVRRNLNFSEASLESSPDITAAKWIHSHTDAGAVVAARHVPLVYHYSQRRTIWFAPITRPEVMMQGIREHHIRYIVVIDRDYSYYLPPDELCFEKVEKAYPEAFRLAARIEKARVYEVLPQTTSEQRERHPS